MTETHVVLGEVINGTLPESLTLSEAKETWNALIQRHEFTVLEARRHNSGDHYSETLVVDCENDSVPSRNRVVIQYREKLGLLFHSKPDLFPEVRALRPGFPATMHQYHVPDGEPPSLCIYFEPWTVVRTTWTPQKHLNRILWWLAETACGTLHRPDQPLEQLYFRSPYELILPYDFEEKVANKGYKLVAMGRGIHGSNELTLVGAMHPLNAPTGESLDLPCIVLSLPPIVHGPIEHFPHTLGRLHDQLEKRGAPFSRKLFDTFFDLSRDGIFARPKSPNTLLILHIPLLREEAGLVERTIVKGFIVQANIVDLGIASGALQKVDNRYLVMNLVGVEKTERQDWRDFGLDPLEVAQAFTPRLARQACGLEEEGPTGTLAGVGALGSEMFNLWARSGWGQWTLVDPDHIKPHNLARHTAFECHVGFYKVDVVKDIADLLIPQQPSKTTAIAEDATKLENEKVRIALDSADIVVDATTTLDFPRALAARDSIKRALSVFVTPSGCGAVMLVEDADRTIRLDTLEAQYYRHVISQHWGTQHLIGSHGHMWAGAGCRDFSAVISNELITVHGANLARMVRFRAAEPEASMHIWHYNPDTGAITVDSYKPMAPLAVAINGLQIVWDEEIREKIRAQRENHLPSETGGVLLGYFDITLHKVFVVDALAAPPDSRETPTSFIRGIEGLEAAVKEAGQRTANIVGYVGEWHSHPRHYSSCPSSTDIVLLADLAAALEHEGLPALMLIVGEHEESWYAGKLV